MTLHPAELDPKVEVDPTAERLARVHALWAGKNPDEPDKAAGRRVSGMPMWRYFVCAAERDLVDLRNAGLGFRLAAPDVPLPLVIDAVAREINGARVARAAIRRRGLSAAEADGVVWRQALADARYLFDLCDLAGLMLVADAQQLMVEVD